MRVLVTGGRGFQTVSYLFKCMNALHAHRPITLLIHGGAHGADTVAGEWAKANGIPVLPFPVSDAEWTKSKRAGNKRNFRMLHESKPDLVVAFPGGTGTADMVAKARNRKVPVLLVPMRESA